jgi:hypothetical protein
LKGEESTPLEVADATLLVVEGAAGCTVEELLLRELEADAIGRGEAKIETGFEWLNSGLNQASSCAANDASRSLLLLAD